MSMAVSSRWTTRTTNTPCPPSLTIGQLHMLYDLNCRVGEFDRMWIADEKHRGRTCGYVWMSKFSHRGMAWEVFQMLWSVIDGDQADEDAMTAPEDLIEGHVLERLLALGGVGNVAPENNVQSNEMLPPYSISLETDGESICPEPSGQQWVQEAAGTVPQDYMSTFFHGQASLPTYSQASMLDGAAVYFPHQTLAKYSGIGSPLPAFDTVRGSNVEDLSGDNVTQSLRGCGAIKTFAESVQQRTYYGPGTVPPYVVRITPVPLPPYVTEALPLLMPPTQAAPSPLTALAAGSAAAVRSNAASSPSALVAGGAGQKRQRTQRRTRPSRARKRPATSASGVQRPRPPFVPTSVVPGGRRESKRLQTLREMDGREVIYVED